MPHLPHSLLQAVIWHLCPTHQKQQHIFGDAVFPKSIDNLLQTHKLGFITKGISYSSPYERVSALINNIMISNHLYLILFMKFIVIIHEIYYSIMKCHGHITASSYSSRRRTSSTPLMTEMWFMIVLSSA